MDIVAGFELTPVEEAVVYTYVFGLFAAILAPGLILLFLGFKKWRATKAGVPANSKWSWRTYMLLGGLYLLCIPGYFVVDKVMESYRTLSSFQGEIYILDRASGYEAKRLRYDSARDELKISYQNVDSKKLGLESMQSTKDSSASCSRRGLDCDFTFESYADLPATFQDKQVFAKSSKDSSNSIGFYVGGGSYRLTQHSYTHAEPTLTNEQLLQLLNHLEPAGNRFILAVKRNLPFVR